MFLVDSDPTVDESLKYHGQIKLLSSNFFPTVCVDGIYLSLMILILFVFSRISIDSCFASKLLLCFQSALMILLVLDRERGCYNASDFVNNSLFTGILVTLLFTFTTSTSEAFSARLLQAKPNLFSQKSLISSTIESLRHQVAR